MGTPEGSRPGSRQAIIVLGMHRSGTSALTGTLIQLGVQGPKTLVAPLADNPRGFFESLHILDLHEQILESGGSRYDDWRRFECGRMSPFEFEKHRARAKHIVLEEFGDAPLIVVKDPRACRFAPFWIDLFRAVGFDTKALIPIRSPLDVARSLKFRNGFVLEKGLLLWLRHVLDAERATRGLTRCIVSMDDLLQDWRHCTAEIAGALGIAWPRSPEEAAGHIGSFLATELRHYSCAEKELSSLHPWMLLTYRALQNLSREPKCPNAQAVLDGVAAPFEAACAVFAPLVSLAGNRSDHLSEPVRTTARETELAALEATADALTYEVQGLRRSLAQLCEERAAEALKFGAIRRELMKAKVDRADQAAQLSAAKTNAQVEIDDLRRALASVRDELAAAGQNAGDASRRRFVQAKP